MRANQDVRDIVAEYAVGAPFADGFAALRSVSQAWRLAVDGRVRNLVAVDQPEVSPWTAAAGNHAWCPDAAGDMPERGVEGTARAPTPLLLDAAALFSVSLAFAGEAFGTVLRIVVVAFALDGPKRGGAPSAEPWWCDGRRAVAVGQPPIAALPWDDAIPAWRDELLGLNEAIRWEEGAPSSGRLARQLRSAFTGPSSVARRSNRAPRR
jgi:hypothetical protein